jgi:hypothetical protein
MSMNKYAAKIALISWLSFGITGCATHRPVLSANAHLERVGPSVGERDIEDCIARAEPAKTERVQGSGENVVAGAAGSSVVGAAAGGAGGAVVGNAGRGAAAGAAGGAVAGLTSALMRGLLAPKAPDPSYRQFVERCLREKGYAPAGWK